MKTTKDLDLLRVLADFRLATTPLLAARLGISEQMIRRCCSRMANSGYLSAFPRSLGQGGTLLSLPRKKEQWKTKFFMGIGSSSIHNR